jgi:hypothetical protein
LTTRPIDTTPEYTAFCIVAEQRLRPIELMLRNPAHEQEWWEPLRRGVLPGRYPTAASVWWERERMFATFDLETCTS